MSRATHPQVSTRSQALMTLLHTLLTAISLLLPNAGPAAARPVGHESSLAALACSYQPAACVIQRRTDHPSPARLFLDSLDETALDEEDTDEIEISAVIS